MFRINENKVQDAQEFADNERIHYQDWRASAQQNDQVNQLQGIIMGLMNRNVGRESVPAFNHHEMAGRGGLVDPSLNMQQTPLPNPRAMEQNSNFRAILNALPPHMTQQSMQIAKQVESTHPNVQRFLRQQDSIYNQGGIGFVGNKINIELQNRRLKSMYQVV